MKMGRMAWRREKYGPGGVDPICDRRPGARTGIRVEHDLEDIRLMPSPHRRAIDAEKLWRSDSADTEHEDDRTPTRTLTHRLITAPTSSRSCR